MRLLVFLSCLFPFLIISNEIPEYIPHEVSTTEGLPSNIVNNSVCVISGEYTDSVNDVILPGPDPLVLNRVYGSMSDGRMAKGWSFNHTDILVFNQALTEDHTPCWMIECHQPSGARIDFKRPKNKGLDKTETEFELIIPKGLTNGARQLSGQSNIKNLKLTFYPKDKKGIVVTTSGTGKISTFEKMGHLEDGYAYCYERKQEKPNGFNIHFERRDNDSLKKIVCRHKSGKSYGGFLFNESQDESKETYSRTISTSDHRDLNYHFFIRKYHIRTKTPSTSSSTEIIRSYLDKVDHPYATREEYKYKEKELSRDLQLTEKRKPEGRFLKIDYYHKGQNKVCNEHVSLKEEDLRLDRVKRLQAPVGTTNEPITTYQFLYHYKKGKEENKNEILSGHTYVYDALEHQSRYDYDDNHRLTSQTSYTGTSSYQPYSKEIFEWGEGKNEGNLSKKIFQDGLGNIHHVRSYQYDRRGNVIKTTLQGNITGLNVEDQEVTQCTYSHDGLNLLLSETDSNGKSIHYQYIPETNHISAKFLLYNNQILMREFYTYDHDVLIQKIADDGNTENEPDLSGVTERHITRISPRKEYPIGLPEMIEQKYLDLHDFQEKLLAQKKLIYNSYGRLIKEEIFDSNGAFAYSTEWEYDEHGNITKETNPLGHTLVKKYDENDNLIFQQGPCHDFYIQNTYDFSNRLIKQEEIHNDGNTFATTHYYNYLGQCEKTINPYGHATYQKFDDMGRLISIQAPPVLNEKGDVVIPEIKKSYDIANSPISLIDAKNQETKTQFNIKGQPLRIDYPDGTFEQMVYRLDGQLIEKKGRNGIRFLYERDYLGRVIKEIQKNKEETRATEYTYNAFHLVKTVDAEGNTTQFTYDGAGRLKKTTQENRMTENFYDSLGRVCETREYLQNDHRSTFKKYDFLGQVLEERIEDSSKKLLQSSFYTYDERGNKIFSQTGDQKTTTQFDSRNNIVKITNALGEETHTTYNTQFINELNQQVLQTITTDPLGYQTVDTYDASNRLVSTERKNPFGIKVAHQKIFYDLSGNLSRTLNEVIEQGQEIRRIENIIEYTSDNQVSAIIEGCNTPEQKITRSLYNRLGQKYKTIKPDGTILFYSYDLFGRLQKLTSSDLSISYTYEYDKLDRVTKIKDEKLKKETLREYDSFGEITKETFAHGLSVSYEYDFLGRVKVFHLPDQTQVDYVYNALDLKEIHRRGKTKYSHKDLIHNLSGQVLQSKLPGKAGDLFFSYNSAGQRTQISSPKFNQKIPQNGIDKAGNLTHFILQDIPYHFTYDDLYQVQSEQGHQDHTYLHDSLFNRTKKDDDRYSHNALNQIIKQNDKTLQYDSNGNLIAYNGSQFTYDALDRLIKVKNNKGVTHYFYDSFNRRVSKKHDQKHQLYVYQGQEEIGMWENGAFKEFRVLGASQRHPMVALELNNIPYIPIHDISGNVAQLQDLEGNILEQYRYTTFGEIEILSPSGKKLSTALSPYQYASKRLDPETGYIFFGLRYYDPSLGRWITPDPAGFADGPNLYAYVHNNPLLYYDQFGLFSLFEEQFDLRESLSKYYSPVNYKGRPDSPIQHVNFEDNFSFVATSKGEAFQRSRICYINDFINPSTGKNYNFPPFPKNKNILFDNGICNKIDDVRDSLLCITNITPYNAAALYRPSYGIDLDLVYQFEGLHNFIGFEAVRLAQKFYNDFDATSDLGATMLTIPHSNGAVTARNSLLDSSDRIRNRVEAIPFCPGAYIEKELCKRVWHYESSDDPIPKRADPKGRIKCNQYTTILPRHPSAQRKFDHSFNSPTFEEALRKEINDYMSR